MKLQFKFREDCAAPAREALATELRDEGAVEVRRLFPQEKDTELAALHVVEVEEGGTARRLIELLEKSPTVEFAEAQTKRRAL